MSTLFLRTRSRVGLTSKSAARGQEVLGSRPSHITNPATGVTCHDLGVIPVNEMIKRGKPQLPNLHSSRGRPIRRVSMGTFRSSTAMTNAEDTAPQFSDCPYSWDPDCGVTLDDFLKKVRARYLLGYFIIGAQQSTEAVNGRG